MNDTSYDVRIHKTIVYIGSKTRTYKVRWQVGKNRYTEPFKTSGLADSFRSSLVTAARTGEAFRLEDGLPLSATRGQNKMSWYEFACSYVDMKWSSAAATYRRGIAEAMVTVTVAMLEEGRGRPDDAVIRSALHQWAFNTSRRTSGKIPEEVRATLHWIRQNSRPVSVLADKEHLRPVMNAIASKLDGSPSAATVTNRKRAVLFNALDYAVERKALNSNPIPTLKWSPPRKASHEVDRRSVVNPIQARSLLNVIRETPRSGRRLRACFACSYFAALRPEEAVNLRRTDLVIPDLAWDTARKEHVPPANDWGEFSLRRSAPHAGREWTDSGRARDDRGLKHRPEGEERIVPIPPELTEILRAHLAEFPPDAQGRLFYGIRGGPVPVITYNRTWQKARSVAFSPEVLATPLAETPYTLRHAAVSTWLSGGVAATQVAAWAGHSLEVLLKVYAKCLHGRDSVARAAMGDSYR